MSGKFAFEWAKSFSNSDLKRGTVAILRALQTFLNNDNGYGYPTIQQIAREAKATDRTVKTHLKIARQKGWLIIGKNAHKKNSYPNNTYQAIIPNIPSENSSLRFINHGESFTKPNEKNSINLVKNIPTNSNINSNNSENKQLAYFYDQSMKSYYEKRKLEEVKK